MDDIQHWLERISGLEKIIIDQSSRINITKGEVDYWRGLCHAQLEKLGELRAQQINQQWKEGARVAAAYAFIHQIAKMKWYQAYKIPWVAKDFIHRTLQMET